MVHGTWPDTVTEKTATFLAVSARFVRPTATTEAGNRGAWCTAAEINLLAGQTAATRVLPWSGRTAAASDEEVARVNGRAGNVLDGSAATLWHSRWSPAPAAPLPHTITIDTKAACERHRTGGSAHTRSELAPKESPGPQSPAGPDRTWPACQSNVTISTGEVFGLGGSWFANPQKNQVEQWTIVNESGGWFHPVHIHLIDGKIIGRNTNNEFAVGDLRNNDPITADEPVAETLPEESFSST